MSNHQTINQPVSSVLCALSTKPDRKCTHAKEKHNFNLIKQIKPEENAACLILWVLASFVAQSICTFDKLSGDNMLGEVMAVSHISSR